MKTLTPFLISILALSSYDQPTELLEPVQLTLAGTSYHTEIKQLFIRTSFKSGEVKLIRLTHWLLTLKEQRIRP